MAYIVGVRAAIAAVLDGAIGDRDVWAYPHAPDQLLKDAVLVLPGRVLPPTVATAGATVSAIDLMCVSATTMDAPAMDDLDDFLSDVLGVLDASDLFWKQAEYVVWDDTHPAYRIELEYIS